MLQRICFVTVIFFSLTFLFAIECSAQRRPKPTQKQTPKYKVTTKATATKNPVLPKAAHNKAVQQFRAVRNQLYGSQKLASQKHANASTSLRRARETERALKDNHLAAITAALKRVPSVRKEGVSRRDHAMRDQGVRSAAKSLQTATVNRANAERYANTTRRGVREAKRQVNAANRTLSFAKKGDWINAHRVVGRAKPLVPVTRPRKISFNFAPQGPTPKGTNARKGILKASSR